MTEAEQLAATRHDIVRCLLEQEESLRRIILFNSAQPLNEEQLPLALSAWQCGARTFYLKLDRMNVKGQAQAIALQQNRIARRVPLALGDELELSQRRLTGSASDVRLAEIRQQRRGELAALEGTAANSPETRRLIRQRFKGEAAAAMETQDFSDRAFGRESRKLGIQASLGTDEDKRLRTARLNLDAIREDLATRRYLTQEARQALQVDELRARNELTVAKMESSLAQSQHSLAEKTAGIRATNLSAASKNYDVELATLGRSGNNWRPSRKSTRAARRVCRCRSPRATPASRRCVRTRS